jgi:predicted metalloendopeptidase
VVVHCRNMESYAVNAYYDNSVNALFIPAGILQPPFFNDTAKMQVNFGGIGSIVGHEMTHGYDNLGARFDSDSNIRDWFSPASQVPRLPCFTRTRVQILTPEPNIRDWLSSVA